MLHWRGNLACSENCECKVFDEVPSGWYLLTGSDPILLRWQQRFLKFSAVLSTLSLLATMQETAIDPWGACLFLSW
jgi:hypothetical protein